MLRTEIIIPKLILRKYEPALAPQLLEAAQASYSPDFTRFAPWCHANYSLLDSEQFIARCEAGWADGSAFTFALLDASSGEFCGGIGLNQPNQAHGCYNLGYWVRPSRQRQGLAGLATRQLARAVFADLSDVQRLEILTLPENIASQQTALAAGATQEGLLRQRLRMGAEQRDAILFSLVRTDAI
jgi:RimJ/RimL family protein N-acetyltransferase